MLQIGPSARHGVAVDVTAANTANDARLSMQTGTCAVSDRRVVDHPDHVMGDRRSRTVIAGDHISTGAIGGIVHALARVSSTFGLGLQLGDPRGLNFIGRTIGNRRAV